MTYTILLTTPLTERQRAGWVESLRALANELERREDEALPPDRAGRDLMFDGGGL